MGDPDGAFVFSDASDVEAALDRMAGQVAARWPDELVVVGIVRRGVPLAEALAARLEDAGVDVVAVQQLELKRYSDELDVLHEQPELNEPDEPLDLDGRRVLLVDDVLYTGRTFGRALAYVTEARAREVRCAALCVRRGAELPIQPDVVGVRCDIGAGGIVDVRIPPYEDRLAIDVRKKDVEAD